MQACEKPYCIAFGIPTTREEFFQSFSPPVSDYTRRWLGGWGQYRAQFVVDLETVTPDLERSGVTIVRKLRLPQLSVLFAKYRVIVLFSHWTADGIEFFDGMASAERILPQIPSTYDGVFDLCVCHPDALVRKLLVQRPRYFVKYVQDEAAPQYWLYFYRDIFGYMHTVKCDYPEAFEIIFKAYITMLRRVEHKP
jgi:hypothetical protein